MPLQRQLVPAILGPRDGKSSAKNALPGTMTRVENMRQTTKDRYEKRNGAARVTTLASGAGRRCLGVNAGQELLAWDTTNSYAKENTGAGAFSARNSIFTYLPRERSYGAQGRYADSAYSSGKIFLLDGKAGKLSVVEAVTGKVIARNVATGASGNARILAANGKIVILFWTTGASTLLQGIIIDPATPTTIPAPITIHTVAVGVIRAFDAIVRGTNIEIAILRTAAPMVLEVRRYDPATGVSAATGSYSVTTIGAGTFRAFNLAFLDHDGTTSNFHVVISYYQDSGAVHTLVCADLLFPTSMAGALTITTLITEANNVPTTTLRYYRTIAGVAATDGSITVVAERAFELVDGGSSAIHIDFTDTVLVKATRSNAGVVASADLVRSVGLASRIWTYSGAYYVLVNYASNTVGNGFAAVMNLSTLHTAARAFDGKNWGVFGITSDGYPWGDIATASNWPNHTAAVPVEDTKLATPTVESSGARVTVPYVIRGNDYEIATLTLDADSALVGPPKEVNGCAVIPGGVTRLFDGDSATELGFHHMPEQPRLTRKAGGTLTAGIYKVIVVFSWVDARGRLHESIPSIPGRDTTAAASTQSITLIAGQQAFDIFIPPYRFTDKRGTFGAKVQCDIYVTSVNPGTNPPYYYQGSIENDVASNALTVASNTLIGGATVNTANRELYVRGDFSVLENWPAPASTAVEVAGQRVWLVGANDRQVVYPSKILEEGLGPSFNDEVLTVRIDDANGDITAISAVADDKIVAFKAAKPYGIWGTGPNNIGDGQFSDPTPLSSDVGTDSPVVAATALGAIFRATNDKGFWIVDANLLVSKLPELDDITGKTLADAVVQGTLARIATTDGEVFVFDTVWRRWYVDTGRATRGATLWQNKYTWIDATGIIRQEDTTRWDDDTVNYAYALETTWLSMKGLAGYGRTYAVDVIGDYVGAHHSKVTAYLNFNTADTLFWTKDFTSGAPSRYHWRCPFTLRKQENTAVKLRIEEYFSGNSPTAAAAFEALVFDIGFDGKLARLPAALKATNG